jgi:hypothetical protein
MQVDFKKITFRPLNLFPKDALEQKLLARTSLLQYVTFQFFAVSVLLALPVKLILRFGLNNQVRVGNSLVQHMSDVEERS